MTKVVEINVPVQKYSGRCDFEDIRATIHGASPREKLFPSRLMLATPQVSAILDDFLANKKTTAMIAETLITTKALCPISGFILRLRKMEF